MKKLSGALLALCWLIFTLTGVIRLLAGCPLLMRQLMLRFSPPEISLLPESEYAGITEMITAYLTGHAETFQYTFSREGFTYVCFHDYEALHMADCRALILLDGRICLSAFVLLLPLLWLCRRHSAEAAVGVLRAYVLAAILISVLLIAALTDFNSLFLTFHRLAFTNSLWLLSPQTDLLIRLMPTAFFTALGGIGLILWIAVSLPVPLIAFRIKKEYHLERRKTSGTDSGTGEQL